MSIPFPDKKYQIIYADPPWEYKESGSGNRVVRSKYPTMNIEDIKKMPVNNITNDNCILFLWTTFPRLQEGLETIKAWGFKYSSLGFCWLKRNKKSNSLFWGMGYWTRQNPEICLIGLKGKPQRTNIKNIHCIIESEIGKHSKKPDIIRDKIINIVGDLPRIELFARQRTAGWDVWGNEI